MLEKRDSWLFLLGNCCGVAGVLGGVLVARWWLTRGYSVAEVAEKKLGDYCLTPFCYWMYRGREKEKEKEKEKERE